MLAGGSGQNSDNYFTAGPASLSVSSVAAIIMIAATALFLPSLAPVSEKGLFFSIPSDTLPHFSQCIINAILIVSAVILAFIFNKKYSFVRGTDTLLPTAMAVILSSNPANTSYLGSPMVLLIVNLVCLDIMMKTYNSRNATNSLFAVATYLSLGSLVQFAFLPFMIVYPIMAIMIKVLRFKECIAYLMGLVAPYWVAFGFGLISFSEFSIPQFLATPPSFDGDYLVIVLASLLTLALVGLMMSLNNSMLIYAGNMRVRTFNNMINLLGFACAIFMIADFENFTSYTSSFCFAVSVQISNFFAMRRIHHSPVWFWSLLSVFIILFIFMFIS